MFFLTVHCSTVRMNAFLYFSGKPSGSVKWWVIVSILLSCSSKFTSVFMAACPYHSRYFGWFDPHWPEGMDKTLTPFVSTRPRGVVEKCTFCHHRWNLAKEKARKEGGDPNSLPDGAYVPACAEACPTGAISFGDLKNPEHKVHELHQSKYARRILERLGTDPQVYYMRGCGTAIRDSNS